MSAGGPPPELCALLESFSSGNAFPRVIVFDLDHTLWPLFLCRSAGPPFKRAGTGPHGNLLHDSQGRRFGFFPDVPGILRWLSKVMERRSLQIAIASRSEQPAWCRDVLGLLPLGFELGSPQPVASDILAPELVHIIPRTSKKTHLAKIMTAAGISSHEALFFDDERTNVNVANAMGVVAIEVGTRTGRAEGKAGLTWAAFADGLRVYAAKRKSSAILTSWIKKRPRDEVEDEE